MKFNTICGLPGFGSPGKDGKIGDPGNNIFINDSSKNLHKVISLNDLVLYENGDVHIVDYYDKFSGYTTKLIDKNIIKSAFSIDSSIISTTYDVKVGTNIKTTSQLEKLNNKINFVFKESDSSLLNINDDINLLFDSSTSEYVISSNKKNEILINNLYVNGNTNVITTNDCNNMELLLKSFETVDEITKINYRCQNDDFLLLGIDKNNKIHILRDFNYDNNIVEFNSADILYYRLFYKMNAAADDVIFKIFTNKNVQPDISPVTIKNVETYNKYTNIYNGDRNIIFIESDSSDSSENEKYDAKITFTDNITTCSITNKKISFEYNDDTLYFKNLDQIGFGKHAIKLIINHITYNLSIENKSPLDDNIIADSSILISEYSDGYLSLTDETYGVPVNAFMEAYKISTENINDNAALKFDINISFSDEIKSDVSVYYKLYSIDELNIINTKSIASEAENVTLLNDKSNKISFESTDYEKDNILVLYYEFNEPFMSFITSDINVKISNKDKIISNSISRKTYVIPWEISGMNDISNDDGIDVRIHNIVSVPVGNNVFPKDLTSIKISPAINLYDKQHIDSSFNYKKVENLSNVIYPSTFYLMMGYNMTRNNNNLEFIVKISRSGDEITYTGAQYQYSQIENKYPIWMPVDANINLANDNYYIEDNCKCYRYLNTFPTTSKSEFDPTSPNGLIVKRFPVANREQTLITNNFDFLSFAKWTLPITTYDASTMTYKTNVFDFVDMNTARVNNDKNSTLYSLYWQVSPRFVKKNDADIYLDGAVNLLKMPKIGNANNKNCFILNETAREFLNNRSFTINPSASLNDLLYTEVNDNHGDFNFGFIEFDKRGHKTTLS